MAVNGPSLNGADSTTRKKWKDNAELSFVSANGNTKSTTIGVQNLVQVNMSKIILELTAGVLGAESDKGVSAEQYNAGEKTSWMFGVNNYFFEKFAWDKNRFAGIAHRYDASVGLGRDFIKRAKNHLMLELGGGYINEQRIKSPRNDFASGRAFGKYERILSDTANGFVEGEYLHNFDDPDGYRLNAQTGLVATINSFLSLRVSYMLRRVNEPPAGFGKTDTVTSTTLIFNY